MIGHGDMVGCGYVTMELYQQTALLLLPQHRQAVWQTPVDCAVYKRPLKPGRSVC